MKKMYIFWFLIGFLVGISVMGNLEEDKKLKYDFENFTTEDAMYFIKNEGIEMPDGFLDISNHEETVLNIITSAYETTEYFPHYSYTEMQEFALEIVKKVHLNMEE